MKGINLFEFMEFNEYLLLSGRLHNCEFSGKKLNHKNPKNTNEVGPQRDKERIGFLNHKDP